MMTFSAGQIIKYKGGIDEVLRLVQATSENVPYYNTHYYFGSVAYGLEPIDVGFFDVISDIFTYGEVDNE